MGIKVDFVTEFVSKKRSILVANGWAKKQVVAD